jgi:hypothetical protein
MIARCSFRFLSLVFVIFITHKFLMFKGDLRTFRALSGNYNYGYRLGRVFYFSLGSLFYGYLQSES